MDRKTTRPDYSVPAGRIVRSFLSDQEINHAEAAAGLSISPEYFEKILQGEAEFSEETAIKIENLYGLSADLLMRIEKDHRDFIENPPPPTNKIALECVEISDKLEDIMEQQKVSRRELACLSGIGLSRINEIIDDCEPQDYFNLLMLIRLVENKSVSGFKNLTTGSLPLGPFIIPTLNISEINNMKD